MTRVRPVNIGSISLLFISFSSFVLTSGAALGQELGIADIGVNEDVGTAVVEVSLSTASASDVTVAWEASFSSATSGADFTPDTGILTIPAGQLTGNVSIEIIDDDEAELDEVFFVTLSDSDGATITDNLARVTIRESDITALVWDNGVTPNGSAKTPISTAVSDDFYFKVETTALTLGSWRAILHVLNGEAALYAKKDQLPNASSYNAVSSRVGNDGFTRAATANETWYLLVKAEPGTEATLLAGDVHAVELGTLAVDASSGSGADAIPIEGARFYKTTIPPEAVGWRLWLKDASGTSTWDHAFYVRRNLAPDWVSPTLHDQMALGQLLLVPEYLRPGQGDVYFIAIADEPGTAFQLDSRQQEVASEQCQWASPAS